MQNRGGPLPLVGSTDLELAESYGVPSAQDGALGQVR